MHRGDHDVLHPRVLHRLDPLLCIELGRVERLHHLLQILLPLDLHDSLQMLRISLHLLAVPLPTEGRVHPPMNKHAKLCLPPPSQTRILGSIFIRWQRHGGLHFFIHKRLPVFPANLHLREIPGFSAVLVSLIKQIGLPVLILEDSWMT